MAVSLYDLSVVSFRQTLGAVSNILGKGKDFLESQNIDPDGFLETRLYEDMLPFAFQLNSVVHHSLGAIQGIEAGVFSPPPRMDLDYAGMHRHVDDARTALGAYAREEIEALEGKDVLFKTSNYEIPFKAEVFLMSFSLPNFYFHATTAYDLLRLNGMPLGKRYFMGRRDEDG
jgi:hypothetical protein